MHIGCHRAIALAALICLTAVAADEGTFIAGNVTAKDGSALPGIRVVVQLKRCKCDKCPDKAECNCCPASRQGVTSANGSYRLNVGPGEYELKATAEGLETATRTVTVEAGETHVVNLKMTGTERKR